MPSPIFHKIMSPGWCDFPLGQGDKRVFNGRFWIFFRTDQRPDFRRCSHGEVFPLGHDQHSVAVFGFFHKMGGDHHGDALFGKTIDPEPELTSSQRIYARCGFVQKKNIRLVQQRCGHGQALLVTARKLNGSLVAPFAKPEFLKRPFPPRP